jgi:hypothetical protein
MFAIYYAAKVTFFKTCIPFETADLVMRLCKLQETKCSSVISHPCCGTKIEGVEANA